MEEKKRLDLKAEIAKRLSEKENSSTYIVGLELDNDEAIHNELLELAKAPEVAQASRPLEALAGLLLIWLKTHVVTTGNAWQDDLTAWALEEVNTFQLAAALMEEIDF